MLSKAAGSESKCLHDQLPKCILPILTGMYECHAASSSGCLPTPPSPRVTIQLPAMIKYDYLGVAQSHQGDQHEVQYTITTLTYNTVNCKVAHER